MTQKERDLLVRMTVAVILLLEQKGLNAAEIRSCGRAVFDEAAENGTPVTPAHIDLSA